jgi:protein ImuB
MGKRFLSLWFRHLTTDYMTIRRPALRGIPFVMAVPDHGRKIITAVNAAAQQEGISPGMVVADARVLYPTLEVIDEPADLAGRLLQALAVWGIR